MYRKIKRKDGTIVEVDVDYVLKDGEEEVETPEETPEEPETPAEEPEEEEEEKAIKKIEGIIGKKIENAFKDIHDNPVRKSPAYHKEDATMEKSVIETDPYLRSKRPFIKLSKKMEDFIVDIRAMAKGRVVKALNEANDTEGGLKLIAL